MVNELTGQAAHASIDAKKRLGNQDALRIKLVSCYQNSNYFDDVWLPPTEANQTNHTELGSGTTLNAVKL